MGPCLAGSIANGTLSQEEALALTRAYPHISFLGIAGE